MLAIHFPILSSFFFKTYRERRRAHVGCAPSMTSYLYMRTILLNTNYDYFDINYLGWVIFF